MQLGTVKWFDEKKGYGFITPDHGGDDVFMHYSALEGKGFRTIADGTRVEFETERGKKGLQARNVRKAD